MDGPSKNCRASATVAAFVATLVLAAGGCASKESFFSHADLPTELQAPAIADHADVSGPVILASAATDADGDTVGVGKRPTSRPMVVVTGLVRKPGQLAFPVGRDFRLLDAIARSEGIPNKVVDTVVVCRRRPDNDDRALIRVSLREATRKQSANIRLAPDDIVSVEPTPTTLMKDVRGYVGAAAVGGGMLLFGSRH